MSRTPRPHRAVRRALVAVSAAATALTIGAACSAQPSTAGGVQSQGGVAQSLTGKDVYTMSCARCHAADLMGKKDAPKLDAVRMNSLGEQPLRMLIQYGKGRMPAFGNLSPERVDLLVEYLRNPG